MFELLAKPIDLGNLRVRNRIMMTTHGPRLVGNRYLRYLEARAAAGVGLVGLPAGTGVSEYPSGPGSFDPATARDFDGISPNPASDEGIAFFDGAVIPALRSQGEVIHRQGAKCVGQIHHPGAARHQDNLQGPSAPSEVPDEYEHSIPHVLSEEEIWVLLEAFGHAARRIKEAGLDGVEIHATHGYLIQQFLSPHTNHRTDQWGGSLDNRMRFLKGVIESVESAVGPDYPIGLRFAGDEMADGSLTLGEMQEIAVSVQRQLVYINIAVGYYSGLRDGLKIPYVAPWYVAKGPAVATAAAMKGSVSIPVIVAGRINDPGQAEQILEAGSADMVGMTRALMADHEFVKKALEGRPEDIRRCIGNNECHYPGRTMSCTINPMAGREDEMRITRARSQRTIVVVGGGPAGMEAAKVAAMRGHDVTLYERRSELGGQVAALGKDPHRPDISGYVEYQERGLRDAGVKIATGIELSAESVVGMNADSVIIATGSYQYVPDIPGIEGENVYSAQEILESAIDLRRKVVVVGGLEGHLPPPTTADYVASQGIDVVLLSELMWLGDRLEPSTLNVLMRRLLERKVEIRTLTALKAVNPRSVTVVNVFTKEEEVIEDVDSVVLACGSRAEDSLGNALLGRVDDLHLIGDCRVPQRIMHAVLEGARVSRSI